MDLKQQVERVDVHVKPCERSGGPDPKQSLVVQSPNTCRPHLWLALAAQHRLRKQPTYGQARGLEAVRATDTLGEVCQTTLLTRRSTGASLGTQPVVSERGQCHLADVRQRVPPSLA